jgi:hypothetical protein
LVFGFLKKILVAVIPGQKAPRTLLGQNCFWTFSENYFEMGITLENSYLYTSARVPAREIAGECALFNLYIKE